MPAPTHPDRFRIKAAMRQLFLGGHKAGQLPSLPHMRRLFEQAKSADHGQLEDRHDLVVYRYVLRERSEVGLSVLRQCRNEVNDEFKRGMNIVDSRILIAENEPLMDDSEIWSSQPPDYGDSDSLFDGDKSELVLLNTIHRGVFGYNLPKVSAEMAVRLRQSLLGLEPAAKTFLLVEYAVRNSIRKRIHRNPNLGDDEKMQELAETRDLEFLIATKPWQSNLNYSVPYEYTSSIGYAPKLKFWTQLLEPLCLPRWRSVRDWYLFALYNSASILAANPDAYALHIKPGRREPTTWQNILQLAAGIYG